MRVARDVASDELGRTVTLDEVAVLRVIGEVQRLGLGPGPLALFGHRRVEGAAVDAQPRLRDDLLGEFDREAVRVVQFEGHVAREDASPRSRRRHAAPLRAATSPVLQRPRESRLLAFEHFDDEVAVLHRAPDRRRPIFSIVASTSDDASGALRAGAARARGWRVG